jgi:hypothetical protein
MADALTRTSGFSVSFAIASAIRRVPSMRLLNDGLFLLRSPKSEDRLAGEMNYGMHSH